MSSLAWIDVSLRALNLAFWRLLMRFLVSLVTLDLFWFLCYICDLIFDILIRESFARADLQK